MDEPNDYSKQVEDGLTFSVNLLKYLHNKAKERSMTSERLIAPYGDKFYTNGPNGWIGVDNYNDNSFKMNDRRNADFEAAIESASKYLKEDDIDSIKYVCFTLQRASRGTAYCNEIRKTAIHSYQRLDTIVRDCFPQWVWELAGSEVNPRTWQYSNSLWGTETA